MDAIILRAKGMVIELPGHFLVVREIGLVSSGFLLVDSPQLASCDFVSVLVKVEPV